MNDVFLRIVNGGITAGWLVIALLILRPLLKKAPKWATCALWGLVALRLLLPVSLPSPVSLIPSAQTVPPEMIRREAPRVDSGIPAVDRAVNPVLIETFSPQEGIVYAENEPPKAEPILTAATAVWLTGVGVMGLYALISYLKLRRSLRASLPGEGDLRVCDDLSSPLILGVFRPRIYLPSALDGHDREYVLLHERAHLKRKDHWWKPLGFLLLSVYWFHPLLWVAYFLCCRDMELACDEKAVRSLTREEIGAYSRTLLEQSVSRPRGAACPVAFSGANAKMRIKALLHDKKPALWILIATGVLAAVLAVCFLTDPFRKEAPGVEQTDLKIGTVGISNVVAGGEKSDVYLVLHTLDEYLRFTGELVNDSDEPVTYTTDYTNLLLTANGKSRVLSQGPVDRLSYNTHVIQPHERTDVFFRIFPDAKSRWREDGIYRVELHSSPQVWVEFTKTSDLPTVINAPGVTDIVTGSRSEDVTLRVLSVSEKMTFLVEITNNSEQDVLYANSWTTYRKYSAHGFTELPRKKSLITRLLAMETLPPHQKTEILVDPGWYQDFSPKRPDTYRVKLSCTADPWFEFTVTETGVPQVYRTEQTDAVVNAPDVTDLVAGTESPDVTLRVLSVSESLSFRVEIINNSEADVSYLSQWRGYRSFIEGSFIDLPGKKEDTYGQLAIETIAPHQKIETVVSPDSLDTEFSRVPGRYLFKPRCSVDVWFEFTITDPTE